MMIEIQISAEQSEYAKKFMREKPHWKKRFFSDYEATFYGILAEVVVCDFLKVRRPQVYNRDTDGGWDVEWNGLRWDVKNTRICADYVMVSEYQLRNNHNVEGYIFTHIMPNSRLRLLGYIYKSEVEQSGIFVKKGMKFENFHVPKTDDWIIPIKNLYSFRRSDYE